MKQVFSMILLLCIVLSFGFQTVSAQTPKVNVGIYNRATNTYRFIDFPKVGLTYKGNTIETDMPALNMSGRTVVPVRVVTERLGALVEWDAENQQVLIRSGEQKVMLTIGSATAHVDGQAVPLPDDVPAILALYEGVNRTLVPVRFVADALNVELNWNSEQYAVDIIGKTQPMPTKEPKPSPVVTPKPSPVVTPKPSPTATPKPSPAATPNPSPTATPKPTRIPVVPKNDRFTVVIDAGHGGSDPGAIVGNVHERDINLAIALKVQELLSKEDISVVMTRTKDVFVPLADIATIANDSRADLFVSIHANTAPTVPTAKGIETYYLSPGGWAEVAAQCVQQALITETKAVDRKTKTENFFVLRNTVMPAILVETGFMSCPAELKLLLDDGYRQKLASGIAKGILAAAQKMQQPQPENK